MQEMETVLTAILGGDEKIYRLPDGGSVLVNAESLAAHLDGPKLNRGTFFTPFAGGSGKPLRDLGQGSS